MAALHAIWGPTPPRPLKFWTYKQGSTSEIEWHEVPVLNGTSAVKESDWKGELKAADTLALCWKCGQEYRYDNLANPGPLVCAFCGERSTYERSRQLLKQRYPGLGV